MHVHVCVCVTCTCVRGGVCVCVPHRREGGDLVVGQIQYRQMGQLGDVTADLSKVVSREVEPLERMHPAVGTANWQIGQLVRTSIQVDLREGVAVSMVPCMDMIQVYTMYMYMYMYLARGLHVCIYTHTSTSIWKSITL